MASLSAWIARLADKEHAAGVAVEALLDDRDVDIDGIAGF